MKPIDVRANPVASASIRPSGYVRWRSARNEDGPPRLAARLLRHPKREPLVLARRFPGRRRRRRCWSGSRSCRWCASGHRLRPRCFDSRRRGRSGARRLHARRFDARRFDPRRGAGAMRGASERGDSTRGCGAARGASLRGESTRGELPFGVSPPRALGARRLPDPSLPASACERESLPPRITMPLVWKPLPASRARRSGPTVRGARTSAPTGSWCATSPRVRYSATRCPVPAPSSIRSRRRRPSRPLARGALVRAAA